MNQNDIDKNYVSSYDKFLFEYDANHEKSPSQLKEYRKHQRIAKKRDNKDDRDDRPVIWESF